MSAQSFVGLVVSQGKMSKTVKVRINTKYFNKLINKEVLKRKDYLVHDEGEVAREGDLVRLKQCRPLSKRKHFAIAEIKKNKGEQFARYEKLALQQVSREEKSKAQEFLARRAKTEEDIKNGRDMIADLLLIQKSVKSPAELEEGEREKVEELKERYGIHSWPPPQNALQLEIETLRDEVQTLKKIIEQVHPNLEKLMSDENKQIADDILRGLGKDPDSLNKSIRKNLLRKYILKYDSKEVLEKLK